MNLSLDLWWRRGLALVSGLLASASLSAATINYTTPGSFTYTVPPGVAAVTLTVNGGGGGGGGQDESIASPGGAGQRITGTLAVTPGQVLTLTVASGGAQGLGCVSNIGGGNGGTGFGDGGRGGNAGWWGCSGAGGGGGGSSSVQIGGTLYIVSAGGGGGGGDVNVTIGTDRIGGVGGTLSAGSGTTAGGAGGSNPDQDGGGGGGGGGGTTSAGGSGGNYRLDGTSGGSNSSGGGGFVNAAFTSVTNTAGGATNAGAAAVAGGAGSIVLVESGFSISGNVFDDASAIASTGTGITGVKLYAFDASGNFVSFAGRTGGEADGGVLTDASGNYTLPVLANGTYYLSVDAPGNGVANSALREQTWASSGSGAAGSGPICVGAAPSYAPNDSATPSSWTAGSSGGGTSGFCYGGRRGNTADTIGSAAIIAKEHVTRVVINNANVSGVNYGFSYNLVTNTNDATTCPTTGSGVQLSCQGTLRQFVTNANAITGANAMRFVPTVAANVSGGSDAWWEIAWGATGTTLTGANSATTTIDGRAYSNTNGTTRLQTNNAQIGTGGTVGVDAVALNKVDGPELAIRGTASTLRPFTLASGSDNSAVQYLGLYGAMDIGIYASLGAGFNFNNLVIGVRPNEMTDSGATHGRVYAPFLIGWNPSAAGATISNNFVGFSGGSSIFLSTTSAVNITGNEIASAGASSCFRAIDNAGSYATSGGNPSSATAMITITGNLVRASRNSGYISYNSNAGSSLANNTFSANAQTACSGDNNAAVAVWAASNAVKVIEKNIFLTNLGEGVQVAGSGWKVSRNHFSGNSQKAINLTTGTAINSNVTADSRVNNNPTALTGTNCPLNANNGGANSGTPRPQFNTVRLIGTTLTLNGVTCNTNTYDVEMYEAAAANGDFGAADGATVTACANANGPQSASCRAAGEGVRYLGKLTASAGTFNGSLTVSGLSATSRITAIAVKTGGAGIGVVGDTSEFSANAEPLKECTGTALGLSNVCLHVKADLGVSAASWTDQVGINAFAATGSPNVVANTTNFNPVVRFNGSSFYTGNTYLGDMTEAFAVAKIVNDVGAASGAVVGSSTSGAGTNYFFHTEGNQLYTGANSAGYISASIPSNNLDTSLMQVDVTGSPGSANQISLNGISFSNTAGADLTPFASIPTIGSRLAEPLRNNSEIAEIVVFNTTLAGANRQRVLSYLALKYGITLGNTSNLLSYASSGGATVWTGDATFQNSVFGLGKDNTTSLDQRVSKSINNGAVLTLATGADFTSANGAARPDTLTSGQFLVAGDNNAALTAGGTAAQNFAGSSYGVANTRLTRIWRFRNTGSVPAVFAGLSSAAVPSFPVGNPVLLVESNAGTGTFASATTTSYPLGNVGGFWVPVTQVGGTTPLAVTIPEGSFVSYGIGVVSISGNIQHDVAGNGVASNTLFATGTGANQVRVFVYDGAGAFLKEADSYGGATGSYAFNNLPGNATYYVRANHPTSTPSGTTGVLAEQTWASGGTGQSGTLGGTSGGGAICVGNAPSYTASTGNTVSSWVAKASSGAAGAPCFGGRIGGFDNINVTGTTTDTALADGAFSNSTSEHMIRVVTGSSNVTDVSFGFSFNVVTYSDTSASAPQQGMLVQFVANANAIPGANAMRFVPTVLPNQPSGSPAAGNTWWKVGLTSNLALNTANATQTTIDGRAYSNADGSTVLDTLSGALASQVVGVDAIAINSAAGTTLDRPELEIGVSATGYPTLTVNNAAIANFELRRVALTGNGSNCLNLMAASTGTVVEQSFIGVAPNVAQSSLTSDTPPTQRCGYGINIANTMGNTSANRGLVRNNLLAYTNGTSLVLQDDFWLVTDNQLWHGSYTTSVGDAIAINSGSALNNQVVQNYLNMGFGLGEAAIESWNSAASNTITNNTVVGAGGTSSTYGSGIISIYNGGSNTITKNVVSGSVANGNLQSGNGIYVDNNNNTISLNQLFNNGRNGVSVGGGTGNRISQNSTYDNTGFGIDLGSNNVSVNDASDADTGANNLQNFPRIRSFARLGDGSLLVTGCKPAGASLEFFVADQTGASCPTGNNTTSKTLCYGEGKTYVASPATSDAGACVLPADSDANSPTGSFEFTATFVPSSPVSIGQYVTATATASNNTSEFSPSVVTQSAAYLKVNKQVAARIDVADQFTTQIKEGASVVSSDTTSPGGGVTSSATATTFTASSFLAGVGTTYTLTEAMAAGSTNPLTVYRSTIQCSNAASGSSTVIPLAPTAFDPLVGVNVTPAAGDDISCTITNTPQPRLTLNKSVGARVVAADQFTVAVNGAGVLAGTASATTSGSAVSATTGVVVLTHGATFQLSDTTTAGSTSMNGYARGLVCSNATSSATVLPATGNLTQSGSPPVVSASITPQAGDDIICTFSNSAKPALALTKVVSLRNNAADQFTVSVIDPNSANGVIASSGPTNQANLSTTGTQTTATLAVKLTGSVSASTVYRIKEAMAPGSVSSLPQYQTTLSCTNANTGSNSTLPLALVSDGAGGLQADVTLGQIGGGSENDDIACTIENRAVLPKITIQKFTRGATGSFGYSGNNGFVTSNATTTAPMEQTSTPAVASNPQQVLAAANVATNIVETLPSGWAVESAACVDQNAALSGNPTGVVIGQLSAPATLTIPGDHVRLSADLVCTFINRYTASSLSISGVVFQDAGTGGAAANDGVQGGAEVGLAGVAVQLTNCLGVVYSTTTTATDGSGAYSLAVPQGVSGNVCVVETNPAGYLSTTVAPAHQAGYDRATDAVSLTLGASSISGVNFGDVPASRLTTDGAQAATPGATVVYPHRFVAGTAGGVVFNLVNPTETPVLGQWSETLFEDINCDAVLDAGDVPWTALPTPSRAVQSGQAVCLLVKTFTPSGAPEGAQRRVELKSTMTWSALLPVVTEEVVRQDATTVSRAALKLLKEVRNLALDAVAGVENWSTSNSGRPGQTLEYRIRYTNLSAQPLQSLEINDATPSYTVFVQASCDTTPVGLTCAVPSFGGAPSSAPQVNEFGSIRWVFSGSLAPAGSGTVRYQVKVLD